MNRIVLLCALCLCSCALYAQQDYLYLPTPISDTLPVIVLYANPLKDSEAEPARFVRANVIRTDYQNSHVTYDFYHPEMLIEEGRVLDYWIVTD